MNPIPSQVRPQQLPTPRPPRQWDTLLIGLSFGFIAGILLMIGIIWLINSTSAPAASPPGNKGVSYTAPSPTPTASPTTTPPPRPTPTPPLAPVSSPSSPGGAQSSTGQGSSSFYVAAGILFLIASGILLLNTSSTGKKSTGA